MSSKFAKSYFEQRQKYINLVIICLFVIVFIVCKFVLGGCVIKTQIEIISLQRTFRLSKLERIYLCVEQVPLSTTSPLPTRNNLDANSSRRKNRLNQRLIKGKLKKYVYYIYLYIRNLTYTHLTHNIFTTQYPFRIYTFPHKFIWILF